MNQCTNARAASLERCKRMLAPLFTPTPSLSLSFSLPLPLPPLISFTFFCVSPFFPVTLSFPSLTASYLLYSPSLLCSHPTSRRQIYSFLSLFYLIIHSLSCYLICSFHSLFISFCDPPLYWARWSHHFYFLPPCFYSSFPCALLHSLSSFIVFKE